MSITTSERVTYETMLNKARQDFINLPIFQTILDPQIDPVFLELFLIYYHSLGVSMTKPVETWIQKAGEKCEQIGLTELSKSFQQYATQEKGHHHMMINDTRWLVTSWNARRQPIFDAENFLSQPISNGVRNYIKLHEDVIASNHPFAQLAIQLEIEGLSVRVGPSLINQCVKVLGSSLLNNLSFLREHVTLDVYHINFNEEQLDKLLTEHPEYLNVLIDHGEKALKAYGEFLCDCFDLATIKINSI